MAWDDWIPAEEYDATIDQMDRSWREDVTKRAAAAGVDVNQFASLQECDLYLQTVGRSDDDLHA